MKLVLAVCALLLATGCLCGPAPNGKVIRINSYSEDDDINTSFAIIETKRVLSKVSTFLSKVASLTSDADDLSFEDYTMKVGIEAEALDLLDELDRNPVNQEDNEAVGRVKDMVISALFDYSKKFDSHDLTTFAPNTATGTTTTATTTMVTPAPTTQESYPTDSATEMPESEEPVTVLAPAELANPDFSNMGVESVPQKLFPIPNHGSKSKPMSGTPISNPFSNNAFSFTNPNLNTVQGSEPYVHWLSNGGYYVYYVQA